MSIVVMGRHSYVGDGGDVDARVTVGAFTSIAPGVRMHARTQHPCVDDARLVASGSGRAIPGYPRPTSRDRIEIGSDVWIGRDAVLLADCDIGDGAIVGAFAVVAKDVPPYAVVVGNPARVIRYRFDAPTVAALLRIRWWEWPEDLIAERAEDLRDVRALVARHDWPDL
jgi:acetyltransferase-like isoleucine patch superfamily enzyme